MVKNFILSQRMQRRLSLSFSLFVSPTGKLERRGRNPIHRRRVICYTGRCSLTRATRKRDSMEPACSTRGPTRSSASRRRRSAKRRRSAPAAADSREPGRRRGFPARRRRTRRPGIGRRGSPDPARHRTGPSSRTPEIATADARMRLPSRSDPLQGCDIRLSVCHFAQS